MSDEEFRTKAYEITTYLSQFRTEDVSIAFDIDGLHQMELSKRVLIPGSMLKETVLKIQEITGFLSPVSLCTEILGTNELHSIKVRFGRMCMEFPYAEV